jgi:hypothetical protein
MQSQQNKYHTSWSFIASVVFIATYLCYQWLKSTTFELKSFDSLFISQATLDLVSVNAKVSLMYKALFGFSICGVATYALFSKFSFLLQRNRIQLGLLAFLGIMAVLGELLGVKGGGMEHFFGLLFFCGLLLNGLTLFPNRLMRIFNQFFWNPSSWLISFLGFSALQFLYNNSNSFHAHSWLIYLCFHLVLSFLLTLFKFNKNSTFKAIFQVFTPFIWIPLVVFVSVEMGIYFRLKFSVFLAYKIVFAGLMTFLFLLYFFLNKNRKMTSMKVLQNRFALAALLGLITAVQYHPIFTQSSEMFELANNANAQLKLFQFHEIPFVDFLSSHVFSEQFYGIIYHTIFGYSNDLAFLTYAFFYNCIAFVALFYFIKFVFKNSWYSFLMIALFPYLGAFLINHFYLSFVVFFLFRKIQQNESVKNYLYLFFFLIALVFWRLDTGIASGMAAVVYFLIITFTSAKKVSFKKLIRSLAIVTFVCGSLFLLFSALYSFEYLITNLKSALHYIGASQAHGYAQSAAAMNQQFYLYHFIFPFLAIVMIGILIVLLKSKNSKWVKSTELGFASIFVLLIYLFNIQRGIVRHGFMEDNDSIIATFFFLGCVLFVLVFIDFKYQATRFVTFFSISFLIVLTWSYFPMNQNNSFFNQFFSENGLLKLDSALKKENFKGRVLKNESHFNTEIQPFQQFVAHHLAENELFLDFSNSPLLYYYTNRNVPSYFCQNQQNTVDDYLQLEQLKQLKIKNVPLVVFSNYPKNWFDATDGVPNEMRQYMLASYIFKKYKPLGIVGKRSIWGLKARHWKLQTLEQDSLIEKSAVFHYKKAAHVQYHHFKIHQSILQGVENGKNVHPKADLFHIPKTLTKETGVFIQLQTKHPIDNQQVTIQLLKDSLVVGEVKFTEIKGKKSYLVPLSNQYLWHKVQPNFIRILPENRSYTVNFMKDIRYER